MTDPQVTTPLLAFLRACREDEREKLAELAATPLNYLYQIATCKRPNPSVAKALRIEDATRYLHGNAPSRLQIVTVRDIGTMCQVGDGAAGE
jgi:hypothetical protein